MAKVLFTSAIKLEGKRYPGNTVIDVSEDMVKELLASGGYLVKQGFIGENKNGQRIIISVLDNTEADEKNSGKEKGKGKKEK